MQNSIVDLNSEEPTPKIISEEFNPLDEQPEDTKVDIAQTVDHEFDIEEEKPVAEKPKNETEDLKLPVQNVSVDAEWQREGQIKDMEPIALPSDTFPAITELVQNMPSVEIADNDDWISSINDSLNSEVFRGSGYERYAQKDSLFTNLVKTDQNVSLNGVYAGAAKNTNNILTGERAVLAVMNYMKAGNIYMQPLWNSGFWVTLKPPTESALIDLMHILRTEKVRIGRSTHGLALSSITGVTAKHVVDFIKAHIYSTTIDSKEFSIADIDKYIHLNDLDALVQGIICTMYPSGFNFSRSCVADPINCNHVVHAILDPSKLLYVNRRALTDSMLGHMSNRKSNTMSLKDIQSYQNQLAARNSKTMVYTSDDRSIEFDLKTCTIDKYLASTDAWVSDVETTADRILEKDTTDEQRQLLIRSYAKATTMRQYSHYVQAIRYGENTTIEDQASIYKVLSALSSDSGLSPEFNKQVNDLINNSTIAAVGIPTYECPSCKKPVTSRLGHNEAYRNIIPLDLISVFFDLARVKMAKISQR